MILYSYLRSVFSLLLTITRDICMATDRPRRFAGEHSETYMGTVDVIMPALDVRERDHGDAKEESLTISNTRNDSADDELSRSVNSRLDDASNHHDEASPEDGLLPAYLATHKCSDNTASQAPNIVEGNDETEKARARTANNV